MPCYSSQTGPITMVHEKTNKQSFLLHFKQSLQNVKKKTEPSWSGPPISNVLLITSSTCCDCATLNTNCDFWMASLSWALTGQTSQIEKHATLDVKWGRKGNKLGITVMRQYSPVTLSSLSLATAPRANPPTVMLKRPVVTRSWSLTL